MTDPQIERKLIEIMRIINESDRPVGARIIADELRNRGYNLGERAVRYHLRILDERGFTEKHGYTGRSITLKGKDELEEALIGDRLDFVITRIEDLIYRTDYDPVKKQGNVIVNVSYVDKDDFEKTAGLMRGAVDYSISPRVGVFEEDSEDIFVPAGKVGIATVCSITFDGILLRHGIPVKPNFGGILSVENNEPVVFKDLISYRGTSIDPIKIFLMRQSTSVTGLLQSGSGTILANMRSIPQSAVGDASLLFQQLHESDIGGLLAMDNESGNVLGAPVDVGLSGIVVSAGVNALAVVEEYGIDVTTRPVSTIMDYGTMKTL
ncbi:DUF128 domain-containing protein [Methanohalophilus mahii]|uniref:Transcriptional repressor of nif and glnA operons n=1 Tax=Methanohalophilus mahii (strain ATCC 35705 / DSM 5219 / SLP) TaxID=547558 RepID=D5E8G5_METMS|nr:DUF128 domain-containing protein [Methanohalophilus mahii]ADE37453.1 Protein of unknown function DUF128 [Methanohalophilus mahii DSM 5219]